jgi:ACS family D-galactonate transporter-like MFS transporter
MPSFQTKLQEPEIGRADFQGGRRDMQVAERNAAAQPESGRAWIVVVLLFFFMFINYADKSVLGLAAPGIMRDLALTNTEFGAVGSSFFFLFAISSVIFGFTANRFASRWLLLGMGLAWAATQFPMIGTVGVGTLVTCRILLGASEGPGYPVALHATYKWFGDKKRTFPTNLLVLGAGIGTAVAGQVLPLIINRWDWHAAFLAVGLFGVVWSLAWFLLGHEGPLDDRPAIVGAGSDAIPYRHLLLCRTALGVFLVSFAAYWAIAVGLVWGVQYMIKAVGLTLLQAGQVATLPTLVSIVLGPLVAWASQHLVRRGVPSRYSRGVFGCAGVVLGAAGIAGMALLPGVATKIACYTFAASVMYLIYTVGPPIIAEISPARQRAAMLSINNAIYSTAGILAPWVMGLVLDATPDPLVGYRNGYLVLAVLLLACGALGFVLIDPARDKVLLATRRAGRQGEVSNLSLAE